MLKGFLRRVPLGQADPDQGVLEPAKKRRVSHKALDRLAESTVDECAAQYAASLKDYTWACAQGNTKNRQLAAYLRIVDS